jgi:hypothetical protein
MPDGNIDTFTVPTYNASLANNRETNPDYRRLRFYLGKIIAEAFTEFCANHIANWQGYVQIDKDRKKVAAWTMRPWPGIPPKKRGSTCVLFNFKPEERDFVVVYNSAPTVIEGFANYFDAVVATATLNEKNGCLRFEANMDQPGTAHGGTRKSGRGGNPGRRPGVINKIIDILREAGRDGVFYEEDIIDQKLIATFPERDPGGLCTTVRCQIRPGSDGLCRIQRERGIRVDVDEGSHGMRVYSITENDENDTVGDDDDVNGADEQLNNLEPFGIDDIPEMEAILLTRPNYDEAMVGIQAAIDEAKANLDSANARAEAATKLPTQAQQDATIARLAAHGWVWNPELGAIHRKRATA